MPDMKPDDKRVLAVLAEIPVEWESETLTPVCLRPVANRPTWKWAIFCRDTGRLQGAVDSQQALALIERCLRLWLAKRGVDVHRAGQKFYAICGGLTLVKTRKKFYWSHATGYMFTGYLTAQVTAVEALIEEEKTDPNERAGTGGGS